VEVLQAEVAALRSAERRTGSKAEQEVKTLQAKAILYARSLLPAHFHRFTLTPVACLYISLAADCQAAAAQQSITKTAAELEEARRAAAVAEGREVEQRRKATALEKQLQTSEADKVVLFHIY
jgi:hypothetical protein